MNIETVICFLRLVMYVNFNKFKIRRISSYNSGPYEGVNTDAYKATVGLGLILRYVLDQLRANCLRTNLLTQVNHFYWPNNALNCTKLKD